MKFINYSSSCRAQPLSQPDAMHEREIIIYTEEIKRRAMGSGKINGFISALWGDMIWGGWA